LVTELRRHIDPDAGLDRELGVRFRLRQDDSKPAGGDPCPRIADDAPADTRISARQQRVGNDFGEPPAACYREQVRLGLGLGDFHQVFRAQPRRFLQHRRRDCNFIVPGQAANDGRRGLGNRRELLAHFGKRNARTDIRERPDFDCFDESFEHIVEQLDLFLIEVPGRCQEQVGYAPGGF
jgi:hypothetical protein